MNKNDIAKIINHKCDLARIIVSDYELDFTEDEIYDNRGKAESWTDRDRSKKEFIPENEGEYVYVLYCDNVPCHKVDYSNEEECNVLGAADCDSEAECLVPAETKMRITRGAEEVDYEEMGYYSIYLEVGEEVKYEIK